LTWNEKGDLDPALDQRAKGTLGRASPLGTRFGGGAGSGALAGSGRVLATPPIQTSPKGQQEEGGHSLSVWDAAPWKAEGSGYGGWKASPNSHEVPRVFRPMELPPRARGFSPAGFGEVSLAALGAGSARLAASPRQITTSFFKPRWPPGAVEQGEGFGRNEEPQHQPMPASN